MDAALTLPLDSLISLSFTVFVKPLILLAVVLLLAHGLGRRSAVNQHLILLFGFIALALLPLAFLIMPGLRISLLPESFTAYSFPIQTVQNYLLPLLGLWICGSLWILFYLLLGIARLFALTRASASESRLSSAPTASDLAMLVSLSESMGLRTPVSIVYANSVSSPFVWGFRRPVIMMPVSAKLWDKSIKRFVLMHELSHVLRQDWLTLLFVRICCALFWFIPLSWMAAKQLHDAAEIACDESVYRLSEDETHYAQNLLQLAIEDRSHLLEPAMGMSAGSPVYQRINALLDRQRERTQTASEGWSSWLLLFFLAVLPFSALQLYAPHPASTTLWSQAYMLSLAPKQEKITDRKKQTKAQTLAQSPVNHLSLAALLAHKQSILSIHDRPKTIEQVLVLSPPLTPESSIVDKALIEEPLNIKQGDVSIQGYIPSKLVTPRYPRQARQRGIEGLVDVTFSIDINGKVKNPVLVQSQPQGIFDRAVLSALEDFRFEPPRINGQAVEIQAVRERFVFTIETDHHVHKRRQN